MNMVPSEAAKYAASLAAAARDAKVKVMIAPTFVCLPGVVEAVKGSNIIVYLYYGLALTSMPNSSVSFCVSSFSQNSRGESVEVPSYAIA